METKCFILSAALRRVINIVRTMSVQLLCNYTFVFAFSNKYFLVCQKDSQFYCPPKYTQHLESNIFPPYISTKIAKTDLNQNN